MNLRRIRQLPDDLEQARARLERILNERIVCVPIASDTIVRYGAQGSLGGTYHLLRADPAYIQGGSQFLCATVAPGALLFAKAPRGGAQGMPVVTKAGFYDRENDRICAVYLLPGALERIGDCAIGDLRDYPCLQQD